MSETPNFHHEKDLVGRILEGNEKEFRKLVETYQALILRVSLQFTHSAEEAEDITQEVFISIYKNLSNFRFKSSLKTWIYRIALSKGINHANKEKRKAMMMIFTSYRNDHQIPSLTKTDDDLCRKEMQNQLKKALSELPESQRVAFILHKIEDLPAHEVAEILETSLSATEALLHRARKNLQRKLRPIYQGREI
ncbi:MAG: RNA polymerase sigma factor [Bacteroidales bacterium]|jgi:RNA polymerase sigma-70 factor (ECF subfamily)|nr:RNA polymerase sigma factor [Bacteroidales bacterium]